MEKVGFISEISYQTAKHLKVKNLLCLFAGLLALILLMLAILVVATVTGNLETCAKFLTTTLTIISIFIAAITALMTLISKKDYDEIKMLKADLALIKWTFFVLESNDYKIESYKKILIENKTIPKQLFKEYGTLFQHIKSAVENEKILGFIEPDVFSSFYKVHDILFLLISFNKMLITKSEQPDHYHPSLNFQPNVEKNQLKNMSADLDELISFFKQLKQSLDVKQYKIIENAEHKIADNPLFWNLSLQKKPYGRSG